MLRPLWLFTSSYRQTEQAALSGLVVPGSQIVKMLAVCGESNEFASGDRSKRVESVAPADLIWTDSRLVRSEWSTNQCDFWALSKGSQLTCDHGSHPLQWLPTLLDFRHK